MELYQIILLALAVIVLGQYIYKRFTGVDILKNAVMLRPVLSALTAAVSAVYKIMPDRKELALVETVMNAGVKGAEIAEKAWRTGMIEKEDRNAYAKQVIADTLNDAGITVTPQIMMIIDGAIEAACMILPHEKKTEIKE